jgi:nucleoside-diphosphate-sugar epimerase
MIKKDIVACVTGATGKIGCKIVQRLLDKGFSVNVLSRNEKYVDNRVKLFKGGLENKNTLYKFLQNADLLFHCAAELHDLQKMTDVNVKGTKRILNAAINTEIKYLCYISSAGVVGLTKEKIVDENTSCNPITTYEKTKWEAEKIVAKGIDGCTTIILRPTNVIDDSNPGALKLPMNGSLKSFLKVIIKGGECAHIIHADDVAAAAMYFISKKYTPPCCFFVSCDHEPLNTFAGLWSLYNAILNQKPVGSVRSVKHLPISIPYILRRIVRGKSNKGDVRYSSKSILSEGFKFKLGLEGAIKRVINAEHEKKQCEF